MIRTLEQAKRGHSFIIQMIQFPVKRQNLSPRAATVCSLLKQPRRSYTPTERE